MNKPVGFIGTGLMGLPMAQRLLTANLPLVAYNRTTDKAESLQQAGAAIAPSVEEVLHHCSVVVIMVTNAAAIREMLLTEPVRSHLTGRTILQMGTIAPTESRALQEAIGQSGGEYLEAPVLGSIPEAQTGKLLVMVGSSKPQFERWLSLLKHFGENPLHIGEVGTAAALKLALNQLIASLTASFALSLSLVQQQGVPVDTFMQILRQSALYAPTFDKKLQRMVDRQYDNPNFPTKHLLKDTNLFLQEAIAVQLQTDSLEGIRKILETACHAGLADSDYAALFEAVRTRSLENPAS